MSKILFCFGISLCWVTDLTWLSRGTLKGVFLIGNTYQRKKTSTHSFQGITNIYDECYIRSKDTTIDPALVGSTVSLARLSVQKKKKKLTKRPKIRPNCRPNIL